MWIRKLRAFELEIVSSGDSWGRAQEGAKQSGICLTFFLRSPSSACYVVSDPTSASRDQCAVDTIQSAPSRCTFALRGSGHPSGLPDLLLGPTGAKPVLK